MADSPETQLQNLINQTAAVAPPGWQNQVHDAYNVGKAGSNTWMDYSRKNEQVICDMWKAAGQQALCKPAMASLESAYKMGTEAGGTAVGVVAPQGQPGQPAASTPGAVQANAVPIPEDPTRRWIWAGVAVAVGGILFHLLKTKVGKR